MSSLWTLIMQLNVLQELANWDMHRALTSLASAMNMAGWIVRRIQPCLSITIVSSSNTWPCNSLTYSVSKDIAAQQDHREACFALTAWYLVGSPGVLPQSDTEAFLWAKKAANQGLPKAEYAMGYFTEVCFSISVAVGLSLTIVSIVWDWHTQRPAGGHELVSKG